MGTTVMCLKCKKWFDSQSAFYNHGCGNVMTSVTAGGGAPGATSQTVTGGASMGRQPDQETEAVKDIKDMSDDEVKERRIELDIQEAIVEDRMLSMERERQQIYIERARLRLQKFRLERGY